MLWSTLQSFIAGGWLPLNPRCGRLTRPGQAINVVLPATEGQIRVANK